MKFRIVQNDMQHFCAAVFSTQPLEKGQKGHPILLSGKDAHQSVPFQVVGAKHMTYTTCATIGGAVTINVADASIVFTMTGLKIQRSKFVYANAASILRSLAVQTPNTPVFGPELRIVGVLPRLAMTPVNPVPTQQLTQPFQGY